MDSLRNVITNTIVQKIPPNTNIIGYIMNLLNISRESVYRRIRGNISFSLEELAKLSIDLDFSLDEVLKKEMNSRIFFDFNLRSDNDPSDIFIKIHKNYFKVLFEASNAAEFESIMILNHISPEFVIFFNHLFKFSYYRWMHQNQETSLKYFYSDVTMPNSLLSLQKEAGEIFKKLRKNTYIIDSNVFLNMVREIQYCYNRRLINESEFFLIKNDLLGLVNMIESIVQTGFYGSNAKYNFYLSSLNVESNSRYIRYNDQITTIFFINSIKQVIITNTNMSTVHKKWLDSMLKYSTLFSQSNEILQVKYFNTQRSYIDDLLNNTIKTSL